MDKYLSEFNLDSYKISQFKKYYDYLIEENKKINLTTITDEKEAYIKHFYDSLIVSKFAHLSKSSLCDIGSGAGFPGIPLKIMNPEMELTIIEPTLKRVNFLERVVNLLGLEKVRIINARAEDEIINHREQFDYVCARAVSNLPMLLELCIPYVKVGGEFISLKGASYLEELDEAKSAIKKLNVSFEASEYELIEGMGKRGIIEFKKLGKTNPIYPRKYAVIKKKPL